MKTQSTYWFLIAAAALAVAFAPLPFAATKAPPASRLFRIEASKYAYLPGELTVNPGDLVTIDLVSTDAVHGLYVDGYGVSVQADPGQTASLTFTADRPGSFRFRCNVTCGALHPFMVGRLIVRDNALLYRGVGMALLGTIGAVLAVRKTP